MKYYKGFNIVPSGKKSIECELCNTKVNTAKIREDKKNICFECYFKDEGREDLEIQ